MEYFTKLRNAHFAQNLAPALPVAIPARHGPTPMSLQMTTLPGVQPAPLSSSPLALDHAILASYQPQPTASTVSRSEVLNALMYLRSLPVLRGVARAIPAQWQRQVKTWLRA